MASTFNRTPLNSQQKPVSRRFSQISADQEFSRECTRKTRITWFAATMKFMAVSVLPIKPYLQPVQTSSLYFFLSFFFFYLGLSA
jgi:hypothetical protein